MQKENSKRLDVLFRKHNDWLRAYTYNLTKNADMVDELVSELYLYLGEKGSEKLYYRDGGFNLGYCTAFIKSRFYNECKVNKRYSDYEPDENIPQTEYNEEYDKSIDKTYDGIKTFLKSKQSENDWASAKMAELYYFGKGFTIESLAKEVGVSKSTVFLHIKAMRKEIKKNIDNPFNKEDGE
jgi:DNA-directed RNA polymerase specialized sigma24 family protein